jgi:hypothetical protein
VGSGFATFAGAPIFSLSAGGVGWDVGEGTKTTPRR